MPIHPLDGGRIATAVSRWLWVVGLIGGAVLIVYWQSFLLILIWLYFAWTMYQTYIKSSKKSKPLYVGGVYEVDVRHLQLPDWYLSGQEHKRDLPFTSYCKLTGEHMVQFEWDVINFRGELELPVPATVRQVRLEKSRMVQKEDGGEKFQILVRVDYDKYENDRYYEVPATTRWKFGLAYGGLALFLMFMMWNIHEMGLSQGIR